MAGGAAALAMPLTAFQSEVLAVLAANRSESSHFAGGLVLNAGPESARYSMDFDIFHDVAVAVEATRPWEKPSDFRKARVSRGGDHVDVVSCSTLLSRRGRHDRVHEVKRVRFRVVRFTPCAKPIIPAAFRMNQNHIAPSLATEFFRRIRSECVARNRPA